MESSTKILRELLDERGVEYRCEDVIEGTLFVVTRDVRIYYILAREKGFKVWSDWLTPEQAVEATLGRGTCHPVPIYGFDGEFTEYDYDECSECGDEWDGDTPNFCPNCGRKVVDE